MWYSILAGLATGLGGFLAVVIQKPGERFLAAILGCAAGIMLAVAFIDLIPSAWIYGTPLKFAFGLIFGVLLLKALDLALSIATTGVCRQRDRRYLLNLGYLVAIGIALHDLPEGMAIAVGYEAANQLGIMIALAIGLHNIPEGMAIGIPLKMGGMRGRVILLITALASIFTPVGTLIGLLLVSFSQNFISILLAAAAGAMLYIVFEEIWPEAKRKHPNFARLGMTLGVLLMTLVKIIH
jgi:ZIP family zinc transporter